MQAHTNASVSICNSHEEAETAIQTLKKFGFDVRKLSLIGKGYHSEEHPVGFYSTGDKIRAWGSTGAFWGSMWGILMAPAVFMLPPFAGLTCSVNFVPFVAVPSFLRPTWTSLKL